MIPLLSDVTVLELGSGVAVRYCGRLFSLLNARVLRVGRCTDARIGYAGECGDAYGRWLDHGKRFVEHAADARPVEIVLGGQYADEIAAAENIAASSGAVLVALSWFDPAGPYRDWRGSDEIIAALAGIAYSFGEPNGPPMLAQGHAPQITAGLVGFIAGLASLLVDRERRPKRIDVNVLEASMCYSETAALSSRVSGEPSVRLGHNFISVNRNKRGVVLELTQNAGVSAAKALIARSDVVIENYAAGVLSKLGLGPEVQRVLNPSIISLSMPAFGNGGPLSGIRAYGSTVEQASGLPFANGEAQWRPAQQHIAFGDPIAGLYGASAVLASLYARWRLGGAEIDLAQVACLFQIGADAIIAEQVLQKPVPRTGHARARLSFCAVVPARGKEAWVCVAIPDQEGLQRMTEIAGGYDRDSISRWTAARGAYAAAFELQLAGIPAAPVNPPHALMDDPQLKWSGYFAAMERQHVGKHFVAASPWRFDCKRPTLHRPAPLLGEHTAEVLREIASSS